MPLQAVAVFCGSKNGNNPLFIQHAVDLGKLLAQHQINLIYGGGSTGIMGAIADAVMQNNGRVTGVIPTLLVAWEHQHTGITDLIVVDDMHTRKKKLYELCDAAVILPGGFGTMDELFEMLTWNQLSIHNKPIFLLNTAGFYDHLILHLRNFEQEGFLYDALDKRIVVLSEPQQLAQYLL